jgi:hypothetical protein
MSPKGMDSSLRMTEDRTCLCTSLKYRGKDSKLFVKVTELALKKDRDKKDLRQLMSKRYSLEKPSF